jgi:hypothetical protein
MGKQLIYRDSHVAPAVERPDQPRKVDRRMSHQLRTSLFRLTGDRTVDGRFVDVDEVDRVIARGQALQIEVSAVTGAEHTEALPAPGLP